MDKLAFKFFSFSKINARKFSLQTEKKITLRNVDKTKKLVYGGDLSIPTPKQSIGTLLFERLTQKERENEVLQVCTSTRYCMTTKKYVEKAVALAERLQEEGIKKGDYIALVGNNSLNMNIALGGIFFFGAIPFPISHRTTAEEFKILLQKIKPKYFACDREILFMLKHVLRAVGEYESTRIFLLSQSKDPTENNIESFKEFIEGRGKNISSFKPAVVNEPEKELALIMKGARHATYGKGIGITHQNLNSVIARFEAENGDEMKNQVILMVQKIMWMSGIYCFLTCCCFRSKLIVMKEFQEQNFLQAIEDYKVTTTYLYASKLWQLYKYHYNKEYDLSSCKFIQAFDGNLPAPLVTGMKEKFGLSLKVSFGLNELTGLALEPAKEKTDVACQLVPQLYGKIVSDRTLSKSGPFVKGEICFKGPIVMKGFINDSKPTVQVFDKENFFQSGLYGYYDEEGYFFVIDNIYNVIKYKEHNVSPKELEGIIKSLDSVADALVTGIPHPTDGYYPIAFVSIQKGEKVTAEEIINYVNGKVEDHEKLRGGVVFIPKILRSRDTGLLKRHFFKKIIEKYQIQQEVTFEKQDSS